MSTVVLLASFPSVGIQASNLVSISAQNQFVETTPANTSSVSAGAGGVLNGTAATSQTTLDGVTETTPNGKTADVSAGVYLGNSVTISSGTNPFSNPGGIVLSASTILNAADLVTVTTGGAIEGAGTDSEIDATLNNGVTIGSEDNFTSQGNIGAGTYTTVSAQTNSELNTYGLAAVGDAKSATNVTTNQAVAVGTGTTMTAFGNVNLTAGQDPTGQFDTEIAAGTDAEAYTEGVAGIPTDTATASVTSNTTLNISTGDSINSGQDVTIGAYPGNPSATEVGQARYAVLGIPFTTSSSDSPSPTTTSSVTQDGTIAAGIYHELDITIPANASDPTGFLTLPDCRY